MDKGRSRKAVHLDRNKKYDEMESQRPDDRAVQAFNRPAYQSISVIEYLAKKYGIGGVTDGQEKAETVQSTSEGAGDQ